MILKNKKIIITGGSRGIGRAIAEAFLREGAEVLLVARGRAELVKTEKEFANSSVFICQGDVSKPEDIKEIFKKTVAIWSGEVDVLINAAGIYGSKGLLEETGEDEWLQTILVNLFGTVLMTRCVIPLMKKKREGVVINFSGGGEGSFPRFSAYAVSKSGVVRFTETVAEEVRPWGIRINAIAPGAVNTGLLEEVLEAGPEKVGKDFYERSKKQKEEEGVSPEKAAKLCLFLASEKSRGLTGRVLSAVWDDLESTAEHINEIMNSDIYTFRRIKPIDRGYGWK